MSTTLTLRDVLDEVTAAVAVAGLVRAPFLIDARVVPSTGVDRMFSLDLQSSNTGKYRTRNAGLVRAAHTLTVSMLFRLQMSAQYETQAQAAEVEDAVVRGLLDQEALPYARVEWSGTRRSLNPSREYLVVQVEFDVECDLATRA